MHFTFDFFFKKKEFLFQQQVDELICRRFYLTYHAAASRCYLQKKCLYTVANVSGRSRPSYYFIVLEKVINLMSKSIIISLVKLFETCLIKIVVQNKKICFFVSFALIGNERVAVNFCDGSSFERY